MKILAIILTALMAGVWGYAQLGPEQFSLIGWGLKETMPSQDPVLTTRRLLKLPSDAETRTVSVTPDGRYVTIGAGPGQDRARMVDVRSRQITEIPYQEGSSIVGARFSSPPVASKDGQWFAYQVGHDGGLPNRVQVTRRDGSGERTVYDGPRGFLLPTSWSPDGDLIAASFVDPPAAGVRTSGIGLIEVGSGDFREVNVSEENGLGNPIFSPDGRFLAFTTTSPWSQSRGVSIMEIDGSGVTSLSDPSADERLVGWSPEGEALLFMSNRSGTDDLWAVAVEGGVPVGEPMLVVPELRSDGILGLTDSGNLVYEVRVGEPSSYVAALAEPDARSVQTTTLMSPGWYVAIWSPDGQFLASPSWDRPGGIDIIAATSGAKRAVSLPEGFGRGPAWAPDGRSLIVQRWMQGEGDAVSLVDVETGAVTELIDAEAPSGEAAAASPVLGVDQSTLYLVRKGEVVARDLGTAREQTLFTAPSDRSWIQGIVLSPQGDQIVVAHASPGVFPGLSNTMSIVELGGTSREIVRMEPGEYFRNIRWTPSGHIVFLKSGGSGADTELWRLDVGDGSMEQIQLPVDAPPINQLGNFHPDGRRFTYASRGIREIWIMEGLAGAIRHALGEAGGQG